MHIDNKTFLRVKNKIYNISLWSPYHILPPPVQPDSSPGWWSLEAEDWGPAVAPPARELGTREGRDSRHRWSVIVERGVGRRRGIKSQVRQKVEGMKKGKRTDSVLKVRRRGQGGRQRSRKKTSSMKEKVGDGEDRERWGEACSCKPLLVPTSSSGLCPTLTTCPLSLRVSLLPYLSLCARYWSGH